MTWDDATNWGMAAIFWFGFGWTWVCRNELALRENGEPAALSARGLFGLMAFMAVLFPILMLLIAHRIRADARSRHAVG